MAKQVSVFAPPSPAAIKDFVKGGVQNFVQNNPAGQYSGLPILRLLKGDGWHYGSDDVEVEDGSQWAVNVLSTQHGYVSWTNYDDRKNEKVGDIMVPLNQPRPTKQELPDSGWPWNECMSVELRCISGGDKGTQVVYITSSVGGIDFFKRLMQAVGNQAEEEPNKIIPIITLDKSSYQHKIHGRTYKPEFEIVGWADWDKTEVEETKTKAKPARSRKGRKAA